MMCLIVLLASIGLGDGDSAARPRAADPAVTGPSLVAVAALDRTTALLIERQEGPTKGEWPYEGVYRERGQIPAGYRVGGTGICGEVLLQLPASARTGDAEAALARATEFICASISDPAMSIDDYKGGYDVRGWGYCYGARFLLSLRAANAVPKDMDERVGKALAWYLTALERLEIPEVGGWNYARRPGAETPAPAAPFMTAPCLATLMEAKRQGHAVNEAVMRRGLDALERCRSGAGNVVYSTINATREKDQSIPGAIGRMVSAEAVLLRAGRSDQARVRFAVDRFFEHWEELEKRRQKTGTHVPPYGVAPYYFFFAFLHAAEAIELLPEADRPALREKLEGLLTKVRDEDGTWNDRVFPRSAAYGSSMATMALLAPWRRVPAEWSLPRAAEPGKKPADDAVPAAEPGKKPASDAVPAAEPGKKPASDAAPPAAAPQR